MRNWHAHAFCLGMQVKVWFEYIPTGANPGDELSREVGCVGGFSVAA